MLALNGRYLLGILLIGLGIALILDRLDVIGFRDLARTWWPSLIIALGLWQLLTRAASVLGAVVVVAIGVLLQLFVLGVLPDDVWVFVGPAILIVIGAWLLLARRATPDGAGGFARSVKQEDEDHVEETAILGATESRNASRAFRGGSLTAILGGVDLDLTGATLAPEGARLDVTAIMGGVDLRVPEGWRVTIHGLPILGGWENKTRGPAAEDADEGPVLDVRGVAIMGGVTVKH